MDRGDISGSNKDSESREIILNNDQSSVDLVVLVEYLMSNLDILENIQSEIEIQTDVTERVRREDNVRKAPKGYKNKSEYQNEEQKRVSKQSNIFKKIYGNIFGKINDDNSKREKGLLARSFDKLINSMGDMFKSLGSKIESLPKSLVDGFVLVMTDPMKAFDAAFYKVTAFIGKGLALPFKMLGGLFKRDPNKKRDSLLQRIINLFSRKGKDSNKAIEKKKEVRKKLNL